MSWKQSWTSCAGTDADPFPRSTLHMSKRLADICLASLAFVFALPILAVAALAIRLSSRGPVLYRATRVGKDGTTFCMYKLRTMTSAASGPVITAKDDGRILPVGRWLRRSKIDELPQLFNILRGDMSIIGPRPEDPTIVSKYYTPPDFEVLRVKPGLASPGTLYSYTTLDDLIVSDDPERVYVERVLPEKLALDRQYVRRASLSYDLALIGRTVGILLAKLAGKRAFATPPELMTGGKLVSRAN